MRLHHRLLARLGAQALARISAPVHQATLRRYRANPNDGQAIHRQQK
jgi:hypothetical protein